MKKRIAINGFGRIGRAVLKNILENNYNVEVVVINDLVSPDIILHLLKYDSVYGIYNKKISIDNDVLTVDGASQGIKIIAEKEPEKLPWADLNIDIVLECTGIFNDYDKAKKHISAGAKKVIISAPSKSPDRIKSFVMGVNEDSYNKDTDNIVDMASCTTNCVAPLIRVLEENFGVESALFTTVHSYTANQNLQDGPHKDLRRARAAATNIIPTTTGAAKAVERVIPSLVGKVEGMAMRIPTIAVSSIDLVCNLKEEIDKEKVNYLLEKESEKENLRNILKVEKRPLVSSDFIKNSYSSIIDSEFTSTNGRMVKIIAWYDNEWGYSARLAEFANYIAEK